MIILELGLDSTVVDAFRRRQQASDRARAQYPGPHLSDVIGDIDAQLNPRRKTLDPGVQTSLFELGDIIETVVAEELVRRVGWEKPTPRQQDGLWCSPDGWAPRTKTIDEMKAKWCSSKGGLDHPKMWKVTVQAKGYMYVWGAVRARVHVLYMRGDYRTQLPDAPRQYILRPTAQELRDNWAMILDHAQDIGLL